MDGDDDDDLLLTSADGQHKLLRYDGASGFQDVTAGSGLNTPLPATFGVAVGDYDGDGLPDVYFTNNGPNILFHNDGGATFTNVTAEAGVAGDGMSTSASWADFDRDGDIDLYVGNYIDEINFPYHVGRPNELYVNETTADGALFVERGVDLGVADLGFFGPPVPGFEPGKPGEPTAGCTLSVSTHDYDDDGDADILVGNDFGMFVLPNRLMRNDTPRGGPLLFTDVSDATNFSDFLQYNMGINGADYDRDGDWDFYLSDLGDNAFLRNDDGVFTNVIDEAGPVEGVNLSGTLLLTSWGTVWADVDNDGWEDLFVVNGHIPAEDFIKNETQSPNSLWMNRHDGTFELVPPLTSGVANLGSGRGAVFTDLNADGGIELYMENNSNIWLPDGSVTQGAKSRMYRSRPHPTNHWAEFRLKGVRSNTEALGARLDLVASGRLQKRQVRDDGVYLTSPSRLVHFGLGPAETIDELTVRWPSGTVQTVFDLPVDVVRILTEPDVVVSSAVAQGRGLVVTVDNLADGPRQVVVKAAGRERTVVVAAGAEAVVRLRAPGASVVEVVDLATGARDAARLTPGS